jgi:hypothetical protein
MDVIRNPCLSANNKWAGLAHFLWAVWQDLVRTLRFDKIAWSNFERASAARRADYMDVIRNPCLSTNNKWAGLAHFLWVVWQGSARTLRFVPPVKRNFRLRECK